MIEALTGTVMGSLSQVAHWRSALTTHQKGTMALQAELGRLRFIRPLLGGLGALAGAVLLPSVVQAQQETGMSPTRVTLPTGPGSIEGLGENADIDVNMGLLGYSVPIEVPPGQAGLGPSLRLGYQRLQNFFRKIDHFCAKRSAALVSLYPREAPVVHVGAKRSEGDGAAVAHAGEGGVGLWRAAGCGVDGGRPLLPGGGAGGAGAPRVRDGARGARRGRRGLARAERERRGECHASAACGDHRAHGTESSRGVNIRRQRGIRTRGCGDPHARTRNDISDFLGFGVQSLWGASVPMASLTRSHV